MTNSPAKSGGLRPLAWFALSGAMLLATSCENTDYGTRAAGDAPVDKSSIEAGFWMQMDEAETTLKRSGSVVRDETLNAYLQELTCAVTADFCKELRVYVVREASFNAAMAPNGMMIVHSGLLLRARDDAQVAYVLGHEFGHYLENHTLERYAAAKNAQRAGVAMLAVGGLAGSIGALAVMGDVFAFSREQELQADQIGISQLGEAGFDTSTAALVWSDLTDEVNASANKTKRKEFARRSMFDTHPVTEERLAFVSNKAAEFSGDRRDGARHRAIIRPFLQDWLTDELDQRDFGATLQLIGRLATSGEDKGVLAFFEAEIYRLRAQEGDAALAEAAYRRAIAEPDAPAQTWRQLGDSLAKQGRNAEAADLLKTYLSRSPDATDKALVAAMVSRLEGNPQ